MRWVLGSARATGPRRVYGFKPQRRLSDDARGRDRPINRRVEAALTVLGAAFSVTEPLAVTEPA